MKLKKVPIIIPIITIILMTLPTKVFAWLPYTTYEACNKINIYISMTLILAAIIIAFTYITLAIAYIRYSKKETKQKIKNALKWFMMTIMQIAILVLGAITVKEIGMELYWYPTGERYQFNEIDGYISNGIRIAALVSIIVYIITAISYFFKSKKDNEQKIINLIKWQMITAAIVATLLIIATNW